jgi:hypothetical protein
VVLGGGVGVPPSGGKDRLKPGLQPPSPTPAKQVPLVAGIALVPLPEPVLPASDLGLVTSGGTFRRVQPKESRK